MHPIHTDTHTHLMTTHKNYWNNIHDLTMRCWQISNNGEDAAEQKYLHQYCRTWSAFSPLDNTFHRWLAYAQRQRDWGQSVTSEYNLTSSNLHHISTPYWLLMSASPAFISVFSISLSAAFVTLFSIADHHDNISICKLIKQGSQSQLP